MMPFLKSCPLARQFVFTSGQLEAAKKILADQMGE